MQFGQLRRRELMTLLGGAAAWPLAARAQQAPKVWRIGLLGGASRPNSMESSYYGAFLKRLHELGYVENKDFVMEWRHRLLALATELAQLKVDVIVTTLTLGAKVAQQATKIIPIVMGLLERSSWQWGCRQHQSARRQCYRAGSFC
jgi:putative ABC transport system substrate-binding protein